MKRTIDYIIRRARIEWHREPIATLSGAGLIVLLIIMATHK